MEYTKDKEKMINSVEENNLKKKKGFPTAFTVLFAVLIFATVLTWIVPAGKFKTIEYDGESSKFIVTDKNDNKIEESGSSETLNKYGLAIPLENFTNKSIERAIAIPGTYEKLERNPQGLVELVEAPIKGIINSIEIITFVLILSGVIGLINATGAFDAGIDALSKKLAGKEFLLVAIIFTLVALGGTTFGFAEETVAIYPILMPIFLKMGYDPIMCLGTVFAASTVGTMFSTVNPFSAVIASDAAGISFKSGMNYRFIGLIISIIVSVAYMYRYGKTIKKDLHKSLMYEEIETIKANIFSNENNNSNVASFDFRKKLSLVILLLSFVAMVYVIAVLKLGFVEMTAIFLTSGIIIMFLSGLGEKNAVNAFIKGASDVVSVALIIGIARGINVIMNDGNISDTLLNSASQVVSRMNGSIFIVLLFFLFAFLGIFIPSSSGLAVLSMPIVAPLADSVGLNRDIVVSALCYGQTWMSFIAPTALILIASELTSVPYNKWIKFVLPLMGLIALVSIGMLLVQGSF